MGVPFPLIGSHDRVKIFFIISMAHADEDSAGWALIRAAQAGFLEAEEFIERYWLETRDPILGELIPMMAGSQMQLKEGINVLQALEEAPPPGPRKYRQYQPGDKYKPLPYYFRDESDCLAISLADKIRKSEHLWMEWGARNNF